MQKKYDNAPCACLFLPENCGRPLIDCRFRNNTERLGKLFELHTKMTADAAEAKPTTKTTRSRKA